MAGTFVYFPTNEERDKDSYFLVTKIRNFFEQLYWAYYIHLPYYLMKNEEAFLLHMSFLFMLTFLIYTMIAFLPYKIYEGCDRLCYYLTGLDFKHLLIKLRSV